ISLDEQERTLQQEENDLGGLESEMATVFGKLKVAAAELSKARQRVAKKLATATQRELADLGMADARLDAVLEPMPLDGEPATAEIPAWGADHLELTLAANPGEPARPLRKVASG